MRYLWKKRSLLFVLVIAMFMSLGAGNDAFAEDEEELDGDFFEEEEGSEESEEPEKEQADAETMD